MKCLSLHSADIANSERSQMTLDIHLQNINTGQDLGYPCHLRSSGTLVSICSNIFYITNIIVIYYYGF